MTISDLLQMTISDESLEHKQVTFYVRYYYDFCLMNSKDKYTFRITIGTDFKGLFYDIYKNGMNIRYDKD